MSVKPTTLIGWQVHSETLILATAILAAFNDSPERKQRLMTSSTVGAKQGDP
jgi:hypothetical protein